MKFYFADFERNRDTFRPTFLLNDILRFWRTLTLNYEHKRAEKRRAAERGEAEDGWEVKSATKNLKLGFSRLNTCFSLVVPLAALEPPVTVEHVVELRGSRPLSDGSVLTTIAYRSCSSATTGSSE